MKKKLLLFTALFIFLFANNSTAQTEVKINHDGTDGFAVEADGTIRADGAATTWDDITVPFTTTEKGSNSLPDFDESNVGLLFPNSDAEVIYLVVQIPHKYLVGSDIYPHIHWQQSDGTLPTWNMDYKWFNNGENIPGSFTSITTNTGEFSYSSENLAQISAFSPIEGGANSLGGGLSATEKTISSVLLVKLWRTGGPSGDILAFEFDVHYQIDTQGSRGEYTK